MSFMDVDGPRFDLEDSIRASGTGAAESPSGPDLQQLLAEVVDTPAWADILRRCIEGDVHHVYVLVQDKRAPTGGLVVSPVYAPGPVDHIKDFQKTFSDGGQVYTFDIGADVVSTVANLKRIDAAREKPLSHPIYSLRQVSRRTVRRSLARQWPAGLNVEQ